MHEQFTDGQCQDCTASCGCTNCVGGRILFLAQGVEGVRRWGGNWKAESARRDVAAMGQVHSESMSCARATCIGGSRAHRPPAGPGTHVGAQTEGRRVICVTGDKGALSIVQLGNKI